MYDNQPCASLNIPFTNEPGSGRSGFNGFFGKRVLARFEGAVARLICGDAVDARRKASICERPFLPRRDAFNNVLNGFFNLVPASAKHVPPSQQGQNATERQRRQLLLTIKKMIGDALTSSGNRQRQRHCRNRGNAEPTKNERN